MRHLDEGQLHEWLDGEVGEAGEGGAGGYPTVSDIEQHLTSCAECQALLEEVQRVRDAAADILDGSGPVDLDMPPFDEIRTRARHKEKSRKVLQYVRTKQLAWAATLVLAVAVGWYARDRLSPTALERIGETRSQPSSVAAAPTEREADVVEPEESAQSSGAGQDAVQNVGGRLEETRSSEAEEQKRVIGEEPLDAAAAPAAQVRARAEQEGRRDQPTQYAAEPSVATPSVDERLADSARQAKGRGAGADSGAVSYADVAPQPVARRVAAENEVTADRLAVAEGIELREVGEWYLSVTDWTVTDKQNAEDVLGYTIPTIGGLEVVDHAIFAEGSLAAARVRQRLQSGEVVELVVTYESNLTEVVSVGGAVSGDVRLKKELVDEDSVNAVVAELDELQIAVRGAVTIEVLRELLGAVRR